MGNNCQTNKAAPTETDNKDPLRLYVKKTLQQRQCNAYIPNKKKKGECQCGRKVGWHSRPNIRESSDVTWDADKHTIIEDCTSFGNVQFLGFDKEGSKNEAMYVRVDHQTKPEDLWELMQRHWQLPRPKMLISVTGGAKLSLTSQLKDTFKRGLINITTSTGAWIVTGGTNAGVMALVGEAVSKYKQDAGAKNSAIVCIGIATWGAIENRAVLESKENGNFPALYHYDQLKNAKDLSPLDYNHTHFILVDNGTVNKFGAEIELRAAMEKYITELNIPQETVDKENVKVPIVLLVVDGGENTLETVLQALRVSTPVVVIGSSGRAADFIEAGMQLIKHKHKVNEDEAVIPNNFEESMNAQAQTCFEVKPEETERLQKFVNSIKEIVKKHRQLVNVVKLDEGGGLEDIDHAILYALFRAQKSHVTTQLKLSLDWNRSDFARKQIFEKQLKPPVEVDVLHRLMLPALLQNRVEFIQMFMENGADLDVYLTPTELARLYREVETQQSNDAAASLLMTMQKRICSSWTNCQKKKKKKLNPLHILKIIGRILDDLLGNEFKFHCYYKQIIYNKKVPNPHKELFLWALLLNRKDMAMLFWRSGRDHIGGALVASSLCKYLSRKADSNEKIKLSSELLAHSQHFEELAQRVLNECFQRDQDLTLKLLVRELDRWQKMTLFSIAAAAKQMDFMGHTACQTKLNYIWHGKITAYTPWYQILGALFLPPLIRTIDFVSGDADEPGNNHLPPRTLDNANTNGSHNTRKANICNTLCLFYTAPIVKFGYDILSQVVYLGLFSYFVLVDLQPIGNGSHAAPAITEWIVWMWTLMLFIEQVRKILVQDRENLKAKLVSYFDELWVRFDVIIYVMFVISIILRHTLHGDTFKWARIFYCCTLTLFFIRFMYVFYVTRHIGPKVVILRRMVKDLLFFILLWAIFLFSYGVMLEALRLPGHYSSWDRLKRIIFFPYWQMYNMIDTDVQHGIYDACGNATDPSNIPIECQQTSGFLVFACGVYSLVTAILLLNLLIAMFSFTFSKVQDESEKVWRFYRYGLIYDYCKRPTLVPPLIIFCHLRRIFCYCYQQCVHKETIGHDFLYVISSNKKSNNSLDCVLSPEDNRHLTEFERSSMENYMREEERKENLKLDVQVLSSAQRVNLVINQLELLKEQLRDGEGGSQTADKSGGAHVGIKVPDSNVELRNQLVDVQDQMFAQQQQLTVLTNMFKSVFGSQRNVRPVVEVSDRW